MTVRVVAPEVLIDITTCLEGLMTPDLTEETGK